MSESQHIILNLKVCLGDSKFTVFHSIVEPFSEDLEAESCHLCLPTHHQLTQSMVDELILSLSIEYRTCDGS